MKRLLAAVLAAQLADLVTFLFAVNKVGMWAESNPLVQWQYEIGGLEGVILLKGVSILIALATLVLLKERPRFFIVGAVWAIIAGSIGTLTNLIFGVFA